MFIGTTAYFGHNVVFAGELFINDAANYTI